MRGSVEAGGAPGGRVMPGVYMRGELPCKGGNAIGGVELMSRGLLIMQREKRREACAGVTAL